MAVIEDRRAACSILLRRGLERRECPVVLPRRLADRGTHHDLEDLVFAEPRRPRRRDVLVGDPLACLATLSTSVRSGSAQPAIVERGPALRLRRLAVAFQDPRDERFASLRCPTWRPPQAAAARANRSRSLPQSPWCRRSRASRRDAPHSDRGAGVPARRACRSCRRR